LVGAYLAQKLSTKKFFCHERGGKGGVEGDKEKLWRFAPFRDILKRKGSSSGPEVGKKKSEATQPRGDAQEEKEKKTCKWYFHGAFGDTPKLNWGTQ